MPPTASGEAQVEGDNSYTHATVPVDDDVPVPEPPAETEGESEVHVQDVDVEGVQVHPHVHVDGDAVAAAAAAAVEAAVETATEDENENDNEEEVNVNVASVPVPVPAPSPVKVGMSEDAAYEPAAIAAQSQADADAMADAKDQEISQLKIRIQQLQHDISTNGIISKEEYSNTVQTYSQTIASLQRKLASFEAQFEGQSSSSFSSRPKEVNSKRKLDAAFVHATANTGNGTGTAMNTSDSETPGVNEAQSNVGVGESASKKNRSLYNAPMPPIDTGAGAGVNPMNASTLVPTPHNTNNIGGIWLAHFRSLQKYKEEHGHCNITKQYYQVTNPDGTKGIDEDKRKLFNFVSSNRTYHRKMRQRQGKLKNGSGTGTPTGPSQLNPQKIQLLDSIGFRWNLGPVLSLPWEERFQQLLAFKEEHGHCDIAQHYKKQGCEGIGNWVMQQRRFYRQGKLNKDRIRLLESEGFKWTLRARGGTLKERMIKCGTLNDKDGTYPVLDAGANVEQDGGGNDGIDNMDGNTLAVPAVADVTVAAVESVHAAGATDGTNDANENGDNGHEIEESAPYSDILASASNQVSL